MIVKIPVRPHVKKFLNSKLPSPYKLSEKEQIGSFLINLLRRPRSDRWLEKFQSSYTAMFEVDISERFMFKYGVRNLNPRTIMEFNNFIDAQFKQLLYVEIDLIVRHNTMSIREGIYTFISRHGMELDVDCTYFGLRKAYYRYVKSKEELQSA